LGNKDIGYNSFGKKATPPVSYHYTNKNSQIFSMSKNDLKTTIPLGNEICFDRESSTESNHSFHSSDEDIDTPQ